MEVRQERRLPRRRVEQDGGGVHEDAALLEVVHLELLRGVLALDRPRLHAVELDGGFRKVDARDARPEAAEDDRLDEVDIVAVSVQ